MHGEIYGSVFKWSLHFNSDCLLNLGHTHTHTISLTTFIIMRVRVFASILLLFSKLGHYLAIGAYQTFGICCISSAINDPLSMNSRTCDQTLNYINDNIFYDSCTKFSSQFSSCFEYLENNGQ